MDEEFWVRANAELEMFLEEWESENSPINIDEETELESFLEEYWVLQPQPFRPRPPKRWPQRYHEVLRQFDPVPSLRNRAPTPTDLRTLLETMQERRFIRWRTIEPPTDWLSW